MLKNIGLIATVLLILFAGSMFGQTAPPAYGNYGPGWGMTPFKWTRTTGNFSAWGIYDPSYTGGGDALIVGYDANYDPIYIDYADISLQLWIEMYSYQYYEHTSYQWHRLGDEAENITFFINGLLQSNNGQYVILTRDSEDLDRLHFQEDVLGRDIGEDIDITWDGRWGTGSTYGAGVVQGWTILEPNENDGNIQMLINEPCDHWFQFRGRFTLPYHIDDGYYSLTMAGCPRPQL